MCFTSCVLLLKSLSIIGIVSILFFLLNNTFDIQPSIGILISTGIFTTILSFILIMAFRLIKWEELSGIFKRIRSEIL